MYAGFCNATGDYVAIMDADMQDPPDLLPEMLSKKYSPAVSSRLLGEFMPLHFFGDDIRLRG